MTWFISSIWYSWSIYFLLDSLDSSYTTMPQVFRLPYSNSTQTALLIFLFLCPLPMELLFCLFFISSISMYINSHSFSYTYYHGLINISKLLPDLPALKEKKELIITTKPLFILPFTMTEKISHYFLVTQAKNPSH